MHEGPTELQIQWQAPYCQGLTKQLQSHLDKNSVIIMSYAVGEQKAGEGELNARTIGLRDIIWLDLAFARLKCVSPNHKRFYHRGRENKKSLLGNDLLSQRAAPQVPSALTGLTAGFGMEPGVPPPLQSPRRLSFTIFGFPCAGRRTV